METVRGTVEKVLYKNPENNFHIFKLYCEEEDELLSVKGSFINIHPGAYLEIRGELTFGKYGEQFEAASYLEKQPVSQDNVEKYLAGGFIKGIGPVYARKIVEKFGEASLDILELNPARLLEIPGIGRKKLDSIIASFEKQKSIKDIMVFLGGYGISTGYALKIFKRYGVRSIEVVSQNPYRLAEDVSGIGFLIADQIALKMGFEENSVSRSKAALQYVLKEKSRAGHVFLYREELLEAIRALANIEDPLLEYGLEELVLEGKLILEQEEGRELYYLPFLNAAENGVVEELARLGSKGRKVAGADQLIETIIRENSIAYNVEQLKAIRCALHDKLMVLTGGPGTGKTTTIMGIIRALKMLHLEIILAAPTGRAAKRLSEVTGEPAKTLHRLLEYNAEGGFLRNGENRLEGSVFIVDESSMIDVVLLHSLLLALPDKASLIMIGDVDQLPAVGPGNVLKDIIGSKAINTIFLTEIFRQAKESKIVVNAHRINSKQMPLVDNLETDDFFLIREPKEEKILALIEDLCRNRLPAKYGLNPLDDIQILVPMKKGAVGTKNINVMMQKSFNPTGRSVSYGDACYRVDDKVMQIKNNYEKKVFNGDIGRIVDINEDDELMVDYEGELVSYEQGELDEIQLAYCITIHKSQGSEYDCVILPLVSAHYIMLEKNLIYTAITRAKKLLIVIATEQILRTAIGRERVDKRNTRLMQKLRGRFQ